MNSPTSPMRMSGRGNAVVAGGLQTQRENFRVGGGDIAPAERLDAGLDQFAGAVILLAENRAEITKSRGLPASGEAR